VSADFAVDWRGQKAHVFVFRGPRRNIAIPFDTEKLEWCGYPMVKKFEDYV